MKFDEEDSMKGLSRMIITTMTLLPNLVMGNNLNIVELTDERLVVGSSFAEMDSTPALTQNEEEAQ